MNLTRLKSKVFRLERLYPSWVQRIVCPKKMWVKRKYWIKKFGYNKFFGTKRFGYKKMVVLKKSWVIRKILGLKNSWSEIFLGPIKFWVLRNLGQKIFWV